MNIIRKFKKIIKAYRWIQTAFPLKEQFGSCGTNTIVLYPLRIYSPSSVYIEENVKISSGLHILNAPGEKVIIKKYSVFAANCTIITNNHKSTCTIPQFLLGASHVNDISKDTIINEDVWLGYGVTLMPGVHIGRGCVIGAGSIVTKSLPPYAIAIGSPAKIVKKTFTIEQILLHEQALYPENERYDKENLERNEEQYFKGLESYGKNFDIDECSKQHLEKIRKQLHFIEGERDK